jgi:hypothetical protein
VAHFLTLRGDRQAKREAAALVQGTEGQGAKKAKLKSGGAAANLKL